MRHMGTASRTAKGCNTAGACKGYRHCRSGTQAVRTILWILPWPRCHWSARYRSCPLAARRSIAAFLHARAVEAIKSSGVPRSYPVEKLLTGNADAGKAFFNGAGGCKNCHSPTGDLAAIATKYSPIELEAHMLYPGSREATAHATAVVTLPSGEQIKGPLVRADDFMVSLRDVSGWYRSFSRDRVKVEVQDPLSAHRELLGKLTQADVHNLFAYLETLK
ncbi:MAG: hypothetical protein DMG42_08265 [Acidobacteria bacterium]|nr:MAG: hypothetical protein DMG42_08265 [Acidobacteriota bacterium]